MGASELEELVSFLDDSRPEVRAKSAEIVSGLTANAEGIDKLKSVQRPLVLKLFRSVGLGGAAARKALIALVNLSHDTAVAEQLLQINVVNRVMEFIRDGSVPHVDLLTSLLANVTILEQGCKDLLQIGKGSMEGLHMAVLLKKFVVGGITLGPDDPDPYQHVASLLTNVTRLAAGRRLLLAPGRGLLAALVSQLQSPNALRRLGASGAIKNCVMSAEEDSTLDAVCSDVEVLRHMLRPLSGAAPREKEDTVRECLAEAVLVLAGTELGRDKLWEAGAPETLRKGYEDEQHPGVCTAMERTAEIFLSHATIDSVGSAPPGAAAGGDGASAGGGGVGMPMVVGMASASARRQAEEREAAAKQASAAAAQVRPGDRGELGERVTQRGSESRGFGI